MRCIVAAALAALALAVLAPVANAIPIRNFLAFSEEGGVFVSATAFSPPTAAGCGAVYAVRIYSGDHGGRVVRSRVGRFNVCRGSAGSYTTGTIAADFSIAGIRGRHLVCVAASQRVNGRPSIHSVCRFRNI